MSNVNLMALEIKLKALYEKIIPKLLAKAGKKGHSESKPTTKYARGGVLEPGGKHESFDEEAIVYVWHEKGVLTPSQMRPGHAAMKLSRYNYKKNKNEMVRYISWWPGAGASKDTKPQPGGRSPDTRTDRMNEMSRDTDLNLVLKLQLIRLASEKLPNGKDEFQELAEAVWGNLYPNQQKRLKDDFKCEENFANLAKIEAKPKPDQKLLFLEGQQHYSLEELSQYALAMRLTGAPLDKMMVVKQPYAKIYVPCSCLPASIYPLDVYRRRSPWGLSLSAMNFKFRSYEEGLRLYKMQAFDDNCIGAVWECMKSGMAEVITKKFKPAKGLESTIAHFKSLLPSDAIDASKTLSDEIVRLNKQQQYLDLRVYEYKDQVYALAKMKNCFGGDWRNYGRLSARWRDLSSATGIRPSALAPIDKLVAHYEKNERVLGKKDEDCIQDLLKLEALWETRYVTVRDIKKVKEEKAAQFSTIKNCADGIKTLLDIQGKFKRGEKVDPWWVKDDIIPELKEKEIRYHNLQKQLVELNKKLESVEKHGKTALTAWENELDKYEKTRQLRARILVELHEAIFTYVFKHGESYSANPDRRYLAALLLGQFVCWLFAEVAHDNLSIDFQDIDEEGIVLNMDEKDKRLGAAFPNLRIKERHYTDEKKEAWKKKEEKFLEEHKKRDRILL